MAKNQDYVRKIEDLIRNHFDNDLQSVHVNAKRLETVAQTQIENLSVWSNEGIERRVQRGKHGY